MKRRRHTPEQIIRKLREADRLLAEGSEVPEVAKALEVSEQTFHRWRATYGGMKADEVKRLKELERENARLKRIVADKELESLALKKIAKGRCCSYVKQGMRAGAVPGLVAVVVRFGAARVAPLVVVGASGL